MVTATVAAYCRLTLVWFDRPHEAEKWPYSAPECCYKSSHALLCLLYFHLGQLLSILARVQTYHINFTNEGLLGSTFTALKTV